MRQNERPLPSAETPFPTSAAVIKTAITCQKITNVFISTAREGGRCKLPLPFSKNSYKLRHNIRKTICRAKKMTKIVDNLPTNFLLKFHNRSNTEISTKVFLSRKMLAMPLNILSVGKGGVCSSL